MARALPRLPGDRLRQALTRLDGTRPRQVTAAWLITRVLMLAFLLVPGYPTGPVTSDTNLYRDWAGRIAAGHFPVGDDRWQYPPLAALMIVPPELPGTGYGLWFLLLALLLDLLVLWLLLRGGRAATGAWSWVAGLFLLGPVCFFRFDLLVTALAVGALLAIARSRVFGALVAAGTLVKVWPVVLFMALPRDRSGFRALAASALTAAGVLAAVSPAADGLWGWLHEQGGRGVEIEAVPAVPFHVGRLFGWTGSIEYRYGSWEILGPGVRAAGEIAMGLTLAGLALVAVLAWRRRPDEWTPAYGVDVALAATLVAMVTSRVLSPQYMIWAIGVAAVCLVHPGSGQRPVALLLLVAAAVTHLEFPVAWPAARAGEPWALAIITVRDLLLLAATALSVRGLRGNRGAGADGGPVRAGQA